MPPSTNRQILAGIVLATLACIFWSFNFIIARGISGRVPPVSMAFYRWVCASIIVLPLGLRSFLAQRQLVARHWQNIFWAALSGITLFSSLMYVAGNFSPAINLALIGTTTSPIITFLIAAIFLKEKIPVLRLLGLLLCMAGIVMLLSKGNWQAISNLRFSKGDKWMLLAAFFFGFYNIVVRLKPATLLPLTYLFSTFILGTLLLLPPFIWEINQNPPVRWDGQLVLLLIYLGAGTSVAAFFCWNAAITRLGTARTSVFGNLIPVFAIFEAVWLLHEPVTTVHFASMAVVAGGLVLANLRK